MSVTLCTPRLFHEIDGIDDNILQELATVKEPTAIVAVKLDLPPGEMFRMPGVEYGIYIKATDHSGNVTVRGCRAGRGENASKLALQVATMTLQAMGIVDPVVHNFTHHIVEA